MPKSLIKRRLERLEHGEIVVTLPEGIYWELTSRRQWKQEKDRNAFSPSKTIQTVRRALIALPTAGVLKLNVENVWMSVDFAKWLLGGVINELLGKLVILKNVDPITQRHIHYALTELGKGCYVEEENKWVVLGAANNSDVEVLRIVLSKPQGITAGRVATKLRVATSTSFIQLQRLAAAGYIIEKVWSTIKRLRHHFCFPSTTPTDIVQQ